MMEIKLREKKKRQEGPILWPVFGKKQGSINMLIVQ